LHDRWLKAREIIKDVSFGGFVKKIFTPPPPVCSHKVPGPRGPASTQEVVGHMHKSDRVPGGHSASNENFFILHIQVASYYVQKQRQHPHIKRYTLDDLGDHSAPSRIHPHINHRNCFSIHDAGYYRQGQQPDFQQYVAILVYRPSETAKVKSPFRQICNVLYHHYMLHRMPLAL